MGHEIDIEEKINLSEGLTSIRKILNCEIAATETYREVILRLTEDSETWKLKNLLKDHEEAVNYWKAQVKTSNEHNDLLNNFTISASQKSYIKTVLIPAHETHLKHLEGMTGHAFKLSR